MKPAEFLERWRHAGAAERANKDSFLAELCDVLEVERPLPKTNDPEKDRYVFEKDVVRSREMGLAHVNRVATMGQLTASIAHEVSQPIAAAPSGPSSWSSGMPASQGSQRSAAVFASTTRPAASNTTTASESRSKNSRQPGASLQAAMGFTPGCARPSRLATGPG